MNFLDLVVVVFLVSGMAAGYALGFVARLTSWLGLAVGFAVALALLPRVTTMFSGARPIVLLLLALVVLGFGMSAGSGAGETIGRRLRARLPKVGYSFDRAAGAVAGAVGVLVGLWLLIPVFAEVPGFVARQARESSLAGFVTGVAAPPPGPTKAVRELIDKTDFPDVFVDLRPAPNTGRPPARVPIPASVLARVVASTVNVESRACGRVSEGSGFAVGPDLVMTNAHVVAGSEALTVIRPDRRRLRGRVVAFDAGRDLALLQVAGLGQRALPIANATAGTAGAVVGHPGGQDNPRTAPATVREQRTAVGRDIYGNNRVRREVLFVAADLARGDSGAPLADAQGRVIGVAFAIAPDRAATAYALPDEEIGAVLSGPRNQQAGPCIR